MSRRPATCLWAPFVAGLAALALSGCGGDGREAPAPAPLAASRPAEVPTAAAPVEAPPVATPEPAVVPEASLPGAVPPSPSPSPSPQPDPGAKPPQKPPDALQWLQDSEARKADYQRRLVEAEASLAEANTKVDTWERTLLAYKNPFLARPQLSPEDAQAVAGMDGAARVGWADGRVAEVRAARDAAQKALDELKANPPLN